MEELIVMGYNDHRPIALLHEIDQVAGDGILAGNIDGYHRFIQDIQRRFQEQSDGDDQPLAFTFTQFKWVGIENSLRRVEGK